MLMQNEDNYLTAELSDLIIQSLADYAVFTTDKSGHITTWSNGAEKVLHYKQADIIGKNADILYTPEDREMLVPAIELGTALREGRALDERFHVKNGGHRFWASGVVFPLFDKAQQHIGFTKIMRNISEKEQADININEERELAKTIVQSYTEPIVMLNTNLEIINASSSFLKLFNLEQMSFVIGKKFFDVIDAGLNVAQLRTLIDETLKSHKFHSSFNVQFNHPQSGVRSMSVKPRRIYQPPNLMFSLEFEDWVKSKDLAKEQEVFISIASHEIKTPISVIKAYTQIVQRELQDAKPIVKKAVNKISEQVSHMSALISALLDTTRMTTGKLTLNQEALNLCSLVHDVAGAFEASQSSHQIIFKEEDNGVVYVDRIQIGSVITNLLSNAVKYSPGQTQIVVRTEADESSVKVSVQDFGLGIADQEQSQLFQRFGRTGSIKKTDIPGHGLGLHLSKEIIELHGGDLGFTSVEGKGSLFYFTLPSY
ncbi:hypothetical protein GCM10011387_16550 [Pedobacter quisquiliarum]|uniref:histidine kinase n=2 Tax=Pedobacter quisquiliarum TaxID=1834438 RepID=A0A916U7L2_9SPHI|nr:hypothetical protein GCM10011387_16550 [Pedobacter quisquiliarum]